MPLNPRRLALLAASFLPLAACFPSAEANDAGSSPDAGASAVDQDAGVPDAGADAGLVALDAGFGAPCTMDGVVPCNDGLLCLAPAGNVGFCSQNCSTLGRPCAGAPPGTYAYCAVGPAGTPNGKPGCAFLCTGGGHTFTCPGETTCATDDDPPGSGQRLCMP